jgi:HEAT repeat protein
MNHAIREYLEALKEYADTVRVLSLGDAPEPISLANIFVEPQVQARKSGSEQAGRGPSDEKAALELGKIALLEPAIHALAREQRAVILGEPGQGKSTLLRQYAISLAANYASERIPLLVELGRKRARTEEADRDFAWLRDRLPDSLKTALGYEGWSVCCESLGAGHAVVLLDGLDELEADAQQQVRELAGTLKANQVLLTSRPHVYRLAPLGKGFKVYALTELQLSQAEALAESYCDILARQYDSDPAPALRKVREVVRGQAAAMARDPLLLSFMCLTAVQRAADKSLEQFPVRPVPLIRECVEALVKWHRREKQSTWPPHLDADEVARVLGKLALGSFEDGGGVISPEELAKLAPSEKTIFHEHLVQARFVEQRYRDYDFPVETFREYFAAQEVAARTDPYTVVKSHLHRPEWQRVVLYTAGSLRHERAAFIDLRLPTLSWLFVRGVGPLVRILSSVIAYLPLNKPIQDAGKKATEKVAALIQSPLEDWFSRSRHSAEFFITAIWHYHCAKRWPRYERILGRDLRLAARCLANATNCPDKLERLLVDSLAERALVEKEAEAEDFAQALEEAARHPRACGYVLVLTRDRHDRVRELAARSLTSMAGEPRVYERLLELTRDPQEEVRGAAVRALAGMAGEPQVQERLLAMMRDPDAVLRSHAVVPAVRNVAGEPKVQEHLLALARDPEWGVRRAAAQALAGVAREPKVQEGLLALTRDPEEGVRRAAAQALVGVAGEPQAQERLLALMQDPEWGVRRAAAQALAGVAREPKVQERLLALTRDPEWGVRRKAPEVLRDVAREPQVQERLLALTRDPVSEVCSNAAWVLRGVAREPKVQERLLALTRDPESQVRSWAAYALVDLAREPQVQERLLALMRDPEGGARRAAAQALAGVAREPKVQERLLALTRDPEEGVRRAAAEALAGLAGEPQVQ